MNVFRNLEQAFILVSFGALVVLTSYVMAYYGQEEANRRHDLSRVPTITIRLPPGQRFTGYSRSDDKKTITITTVPLKPDDKPVSYLYTTEGGGVELDRATSIEPFNGLIFVESK